MVYNTFTKSAPSHSHVCSLLQHFGMGLGGPGGWLQQSSPASMHAGGAGVGAGVGYITFIFCTRFDRTRLNHLVLSTSHTTIPHYSVQYPIPPLAVESGEKVP